MATAFADSTYDFFGKRYKRSLAQQGLDLDLRETNGAIENLALLKDRSSGVKVAFVNGGLSQGVLPDDLFSLGIVYETPFWIFYKSPEPIERLSQLKGKRIAVGPLKSSFRVITEQVLREVGIDDKSATLSPVGGSDAIEAFASNLIDAAIIGSRADAPYIKTLLKMPGVRVLSIDRADALMQRLTFLSKYELPEGGLDLADDIPKRNIALLSISTRVLVSPDLHPTVVTALLEAMKKEHAHAKPFQRSGEFPKNVDDEYTLAPIAAEYYKNGPSLIYSYIPLWLSGSALRLVAIVAAVVPAIIFAMSFEPVLFKWILRHRVRSYYREMREVERNLPLLATADDIAAARKTIEQLDRNSSSLQIPLRHSDSLFSLKIHLQLLRTRLAARADEVKAALQKAG